MHAVNISGNNRDAPIKTTSRRNREEKNIKGETEQDRACKYKVTFRRVPVTIVIAELKFTTNLMHNFLFIQ
jgi:hypothetical protein